MRHDLEEMKQLIDVIDNGFSYWYGQLRRLQSPEESYSFYAIFEEIKELKRCYTAYVSKINDGGSSSGRT